MTFQWQEYLTLARELTAGVNTPSTAPHASVGGAPSSSQEARLRSAISRAYYAVYHQARLHLIDIEGSSENFAGAEAHQLVTREFSKSTDFNHRLIGEYLSGLRRARNSADYDTNVRNLIGKTRSNLEVAHWVEQTLSHLSDSP